MYPAWFYTFHQSLRPFKIYWRIELNLYVLMNSHKSFKFLKEAICEQVMLSAHRSNPFLIETDASQRGIGCALTLFQSNELVLLEFGSKKLSKSAECWRGFYVPFLCVRILIWMLSVCLYDWYICIIILLSHTLVSVVTYEKEATSQVKSLFNFSRFATIENVTYVFKDDPDLKLTTAILRYVQQSKVEAASN